MTSKIFFAIDTIKHLFFCRYATKNVIYYEHTGLRNFFVYAHQSNDEHLLLCRLFRLLLSVFWLENG